MTWILSPAVAIPQRYIFDTDHEKHVDLAARSSCTVPLCSVLASTARLLLLIWLYDPSRVWPRTLIIDAHISR